MDGAEDDAWVEKSWGASEEPEELRAYLWGSAYERCQRRGSTRRLAVYQLCPQWVHTHTHTQLHVYCLIYHCFPVQWFRAFSAPRFNLSSPLDSNYLMSCIRYVKSLKRAASLHHDWNFSDSLKPRRSATLAEFSVLPHLTYLTQLLISKASVVCLLLEGCTGASRILIMLRQKGRWWKKVTKWHQL